MLAAMTVFVVNDALVVGAAGLYTFMRAYQLAKVALS
jgi:hypothetical protein